MNDDPRDDVDRALAACLGSIAPDVDGADGALDALRPRLRRARTRARVARGSALLVAFVVVGSAAALAAPRGHAKVQVASPTTIARGNKPLRSTTTTVTTVPRTSTSLPNLQQSQPPPGPRGSATTVPSGPVVVPSPHPTPTTTGSGGHGGGGNGGQGGSNGGGDHGGGDPTTTIPQPEGVHTYVSDGGSLTVRFAHGGLTIVAYSASPGYQPEVDQAHSDDVEVRFSNEDTTWWIRVRVEHGTLAPEISED